MPLLAELDVEVTRAGLSEISPLTGLWTYVQHIEDIYLAGVLVEVQAARNLVVMYAFIVAA